MANHLAVINVIKLKDYAFQNFFLLSITCFLYQLCSNCCVRMIRAWFDRRVDRSQQPFYKARYRTVAWRSAPWSSSPLALVVQTYPLGGWTLGAIFFWRGPALPYASVTYTVANQNASRPECLGQSLQQPISRQCFTWQPIRTHGPRPIIASTNQQSSIHMPANHRQRSRAREPTYPSMKLQYWLSSPAAHKYQTLHGLQIFKF